MPRRNHRPTHAFEVGEADELSKELDAHNRDRRCPSVKPAKKRESARSSEYDKRKKDVNQGYVERLIAVKRRLRAKLMERNPMLVE